jgi:ankyrin repeat protein
VERLIATGAGVDKAMTDNGSTPLFVAAQNGHLPVVERLIAAGADVDKARTTDGTTPLFMAAHKGHTAIVAMLLKSGADKSIRGLRPNPTRASAAS